MQTSAQRRFPERGPWYEMPYGIDVMNTLLKIRPGFAQKLDNMEYTPETMRRRKPLRHLVLDTGDSLTTDYTSRGAFAYAHEYVDSASAARLLHAHPDGTILELNRGTGADTARVTGLTLSSPVRFETFMGACIAANGADLPQRGDDASWRTFGAPTPVTGLGVAGVLTGLTGTFQWIIVPVIQVAGVTVVRGDWSNIVTATLANKTGRLTWTISADTRVTGYEIYRSFNGLGYPYYLAATVAGRTTATYDDATTDASLSGQVADESGRNGAAPKAYYVASAGKRVFFGKIVDATDPDAAKTVWSSIIATNKYECEYFPNTTTYRIRLPGKGDLTCIRGIGARQDQEGGSDLFIAQLDSCYRLPEANPLNALQIVSPEVGVVNQEAAAAWGSHLFFVSLRGLEFLGPSGAPILISQNVQAIFSGGGELAFNGNQGNTYITLRASETALYITTRQDTGHVGADLTLVLDLTSFQPSIYSSDVRKSCRFTLWNGPGMAFFLWTRDRRLLCFDNINFRLLQSSAGAYDHIGDTETPIDGEIWTGHVLGDSPEYLKTPAYMNLLVLCDDTVGVRVDGDYGAKSSGSEALPVNPTFVPRSWDKVWDKAWYGDTSFGGSLSLPRTLNAYVLQFKFQIQNGSADFTYIGFVLHYRRTIQRVYGNR